MPDNTGRRVDAQEIADLVWMRKYSDAEVRFNIFLGLMSIAGLIDWIFFRRDFLFAALIACVPVALATFKVDVTRFKWLFAEMTGPPKFTYVVSQHPDDSPSTERAFTAEFIHARELICTPGEHTKQLEHPQDDQDLLRWYKLVLIQSLESGRIAFGILGEENLRYEWPGGEKYFLRKQPLDTSINVRRNPEGSKEVGKTLAHLLELLPLAEETIQESTIVQQLASEYGDSDWSARYAILIAGTAKLIYHTREQPGFTIEAFKIFFGSQPTLGGHASCGLQLTPLGRLWRRTKEISPANESAAYQSSSRGGSVNHNYYGDVNINNGQAGAVGRDNYFTDVTINQQWQHASYIETNDLAQELGKLIAALQAKATEIDQYHALGTIESARKAAERGDKGAALRELAKIGTLAKWVLGTATAIGVGVAIQAINTALAAH